MVIAAACRRLATRFVTRRRAARELRPASGGRWAIYMSCHAVTVRVDSYSDMNDLTPDRTVAGEIQFCAQSVYRGRTFSRRAIAPQRDSECSTRASRQPRTCNTWSMRRATHDGRRSHTKRGVDYSAVPSETLQRETACSCLRKARRLPCPSMEHARTRSASTLEVSISATKTPLAIERLSIEL